MNWNDGSEDYNKIAQLEKRVECLSDALHYWMKHVKLSDLSDLDLEKFRKDSNLCVSTQKLSTTK